jgi:cytidylate kinase
VSIITISADAYSNGRELAESVARELGCACIDEEIFSSASEMFDVPEEKLIQTLKRGTTVFDRFSAKKQKYIAYLEAALTKQMLSPDLVYHGFIGFPWFQKVSHLLKVRIIANSEDRISMAMKAHKLQGKVEAQDRIYKEDEGLKHWVKSTYGIDISDSSLYDLVINIGHMEAEDAEDATETIVIAAKHKKFQPMTYSLNCIQNIALSCRIKAKFIDIDPKMEIKSDRGTVYVFTNAFKHKKQDKLIAFKENILKAEGVEHVEIYVKKEIFESKARGH